MSFGIDFKLHVPTLTYKINAHNKTGVRSLAVILTEGLQWPNMYVHKTKTYTLVTPGNKKVAI